MIASHATRRTLRTAAMIGILLGGWAIAAHADEVSRLYSGAVVEQIPSRIRSSNAIQIEEWAAKIDNYHRLLDQTLLELVRLKAKQTGIKTAEN